MNEFTITTIDIEFTTNKVRPEFHAGWDAWVIDRLTAIYPGAKVTAVTVLEPGTFGIRVAVTNPDMHGIALDDVRETTEDLFDDVREG